MKKNYIIIFFSLIFLFLFLPKTTLALEIDKNKDVSVPSVSFNEVRLEYEVNNNKDFTDVGIFNSYDKFMGNIYHHVLNLPLHYANPDFVGPIDVRNSVYNFTFDWSYNTPAFGTFKKGYKYEMIFRFTDNENKLIPLDTKNLDVSSLFKDEFFLYAYDMNENSDTYNKILYNDSIFEKRNFGFTSEPIHVERPDDGSYHYLIFGFIPKQDIFSVGISLGYAPFWKDGKLINKDKEFFELLKYDKLASFEKEEVYIPVNLEVTSVNEFTLKDEFISSDHGVSGILDGMVSLTDGTNSCDGITDVGCWFENLWIVLGNLWKNLGRIFYNFFNLLWNIIDLSIQLILAPLRQLVSFVLSFWEFLWNGLKDCFSWLYDNALKPLGQFIIDGIINPIFGLIVPDGDYISLKFQGLFKFIDEKLGFLTFPFEFISNFLDRFLNIPNDPVKNITVPSISLGSFGTLIHGFSFNIAEYWEKAPFKQIYDVYLLFIHAFIVFGLYKLCSRKFEEMTGGSNK